MWGVDAVSVRASAFVALVAGWPVASAHAADDARVAQLEAELRAAQARVRELESQLDALAAGIEQLKSASANAPARGRGEPVEAAADPRREQMLAPDLGVDEREHKLDARPELFVQTGFAADRLPEAKPEDAPTNFSVYRMEARWAGSVAERIGLGFEIQYQPAAHGASEELVNDAFVDYYAGDAITLRFGQFVVPFGFDVEQSSSVRESPERAIFAGYYFPGQRDRGAMLAADLGRFGGWLDGAKVYAGVFNGNRFFNDNNDALNVNLRFRKVFSTRPFAIGASYQRGSQWLPPGLAASDRSVVYGIDAQWLIGRLGIRGEYVRGSMPSTLLGIAPELTPAFVPGAESSGAAAFFDYRLTSTADLYWRWDRFANDPVTGRDVRAFNVGYLLRLGDHSRVGFDYQWKNHVTFNDDSVNTQFSFRWNVTY